MSFRFAQQLLPGPVGLSVLGPGLIDPKVQHGAFPGNATGKITSGLICEYMMDEGSGTSFADASGSSNTGTFAGAGGLWTPESRGLYFAGATGAWVALPTATNISRPLTWIAVLRALGRDSAYDCGVIGCTDTQDRYAMSLMADLGRVRFRHTWNVIVATSSTAANCLGPDFKFFAITYDTSGVCNIYFQGEFDVTATSNVARAATDHYVVGNYRTRTGAGAALDQEFQSWIAYAMMYSAVLTATEIRQTYFYVRNRLALRGLLI